jgi:EmrB/QacA subfamily drug resistance transporter
MTVPQRTSPSLTLAVLALGGVSFSLMQSFVAPALPDIRDATGASQDAISWVLTGYLVSASILTPIVGRLGDRFGKERLLMIVLIIMGVGSLMTALSSSIGPLIAGRVVQGIGGGIFPLAFGIIRDEFPRERVAGSIGLMSSLLGVGGAAGVVLSGVIVDNMSFHFIFWFPLIAIAVAIYATHRWVPESPVRSTDSINWAGAALLSLGLALVLLGVTKAADWGWGGPDTLALIGGGLVVLGLWVESELRSRGPLVDMNMMRLRGVWTTNVAGALVGVGMYSGFLLIPQFVQEPSSTGYGFGATVTQAGLFLVPSSIAMIITAHFTGRLERRYGSRALLLVGTSLVFVSFAMLTVMRAEVWEVLVASMFQGFGIGLAFSALANLIVMAVPQDQTGVATGMNNVMRTLGGAVGAQVAGTFLASDLVGGLPSNHAYTLAFGMGAICLLVGIAACVAVPGRRAALRGQLVPA